MTVAVRKDRRYVYKDYLAWPEDERWEIIDGTAYNMSPAPTVRHQRMVGNIFYLLKALIDNQCPVFSAPTDVVLDDLNIVQPDIFIVCDTKKITDNNIQGAPDLIFEIISPATEVKDRREKKNLYERFGIKEYIIIFPEREYAERYCLIENRFGSSEIFNWDEVFKLTVFDIEIKLWEIFEKKKVKMEDGQLR